MEEAALKCIARNLTHTLSRVNCKMVSTLIILEGYAQIRSFTRYLLARPRIGHIGFSTRSRCVAPTGWGELLARAVEEPGLICDLYALSRL